MQMYINYVLQIANDWLIPLMCAAFVVGLTFKACLYFLKKSQLNFVKHVEKKIYIYLIEREKTHPQIEAHKRNFQTLTSHLVNISYFEYYELKAEKLRRKLDYVTTVTDRLFLLLEERSAFPRISRSSSAITAPMKCNPTSKTSPSMSFLRTLLTIVCSDCFPSVHSHRASLFFRDFLSSAESSELSSVSCRVFRSSRT